MTGGASEHAVQGREAERALVGPGSRTLKCNGVAEKVGVVHSREEESNHPLVTQQAGEVHRSMHACQTLEAASLSQLFIVVHASEERLKPVYAVCTH